MRSLIVCAVLTLLSAVQAPLGHAQSRPAQAVKTHDPFIMLDPLYMKTTARSGWRSSTCSTAAGLARGPLRSGRGRL
jgi:hypothetical protein